MREVYDSIREVTGSGGVATGSPIAASGVMIQDKKVVPRRWTVTENAAPGSIVPLAKWLDLRAGGVDVSEIGASIENDQDAAILKPYLAELAVIALRFPTWKDGRAYSQARKIRYLWGFRGVLLAHGDVLRDQILWMSRVGFDALHLREDQDPIASLRAFSLYTTHYQY